MTKASYIRCRGPWPACGHADNKCTACPSYQAEAKMAASGRTPAPEGEVVGFDQRAHDFDAMSVIAAHLRECPADPFSGRQCEEFVIDARDRLYASPDIAGLCERLRELLRFIRDTPANKFDAVDVANRLRATLTGEDA